jgi:hypothetical protein
VRWSSSMNSATFSSPPSASPDHAVRLARWGLLAGFVASRLLEPRGPRAPLFLGARRLPSLCLIHRLTGHRCPGCGMTRGLIYMLRLRPAVAWRANPAAPFVFVLLLARAIGPRTVPARAGLR